MAYLNGGDTFVSTLAVKLALVAVSGEPTRSDP